MNIKIIGLERKLSDGTVTEVHWQATLKDGEYSTGASGTVSVSYTHLTLPTIYSV